MPVQVNTTGERVVILTIDHRHGTDVSAYRTHDGASKAVAAYVKDWWNDLSRWTDDPPELPKDDNEAISLYFDIMEDEHVEFTTVPLGD